MLRNIFIGAAFLLAVFLFYASTRPSTFEVSRSVNVDATAAEVFVHLNDFRHWAQWSPWEKLDPNMKREFDGAESGIGAVYTWKGNDKVGRGRMEIVAVSIPYNVRIQLDFYEPMVAHNIAGFTLDEAGEGTTVTWKMSGKHSKLSKLMSVFVSMDSMVGPDFETGLSNLKALAEKNP